MTALGRRRRGASTVEYAVLLVGVLLIGGGAVKLLGGKIKARVNGAGDVATSSGGGGGGGASAAGGGGGGGGGIEKARATSKASIGQTAAERANGGSGGGGGDNASSSGDKGSGGGGGSGTSPSVSASGKGAVGDVDDFSDKGFGLKKSLAMAMLALGIGSVVYFFMKGKKVVKDVKEAGK